MKTLISVSTLAAFAAFTLGASAVLAADNDSGKPASGPALFSYKAPMRGAPATRVGGGTRGAPTEGVKVSVLAPQQTGYTVQAGPTIYWYLSKSVDKPAELTVNSTASLQAAATPALDITLKPPLSKGIHALRLADHGVTLKPGVQYQWFVAVVSNPKQRADDVLAGGSIERVADSATLQAKLEKTPKAQWAAVYAESGIWYDAIETLSKRISAEPNNRTLHAQRAALLEQVGLDDAAAYDRAAD